MPQPPEFPWPGGARAAVSFSFDDARASQLAAGVPLFDAVGLKATWYVSHPAFSDRAADWKRAAAAGHEIGNHTFTHPCSGNFPWSRTNALENYTLERMAEELDRADAAIAAVTGATPVTFAYPCGQTFVGRGAALQSYIPLVARRYRAGRAFMAETANDPAYCDVANLGAAWCDGRTLDWFRGVAERARAEGTWLILAGHDVGDAPGYQTTNADALKRFCDWLNAAGGGFWVGTVAAVAAHVIRNRPAG